MMLKNKIMSVNYPLNFSLDNGVKVTITKTGATTYNFNLKSEDGTVKQFSYSDDKPRNEWIDSLDFDQLNAVRRLWLEQEDMDLD